MEYLCDYIKAVINKWWWIVVGVIGGSIGIFPLLNIDINIPQWIGLTILFLAIFIAQYMTYVDLRKGQAKLGVALQNKFDSKDIYKQIKEDVIRDIQAGQIKVKGIRAEFKGFTRRELAFISLMDREMRYRSNHGHGDFTGMAADVASGIELNELMFRPCTICGKPRNRGKEDKL